LIVCEELRLFLFGNVPQQRRIDQGSTRSFPLCSPVTIDILSVVIVVVVVVTGVGICAFLNEKDREREE
jgi:hypothetical protein